MKLIDITQNKVTDENGQHSLPSRVLELPPKYYPMMFSRSFDKIHKGKLLNQVVDMWDDVLGGQYSPCIHEFYVGKKSIEVIDQEERVISRANDKQMANTDITQIAVTRAIAKITLTGLHSEFSPAIAANINEKGVEFGWGSNVHICSNLTLMSAEHRFSTYEKTLTHEGKFAKLSYEDILTQLKAFMIETTRRFEKEVNQIEKWRNQEVSKKEFHEYLGEQFSRIQWINHNRVRRTIKEVEDKAIPINGLQLSRIAVEAKEPSYDIYNWNGDHTTVWNIVNWGTEVLKVQNGSDSMAVLKANNGWVNAVDTFFCKN